MSESETILEEKEAERARVHAREHHRVGRLAEQVGRLERKVAEHEKELGRVALQLNALEAQHRLIAPAHDHEEKPGPEHRSGLSLLEITEQYELRDVDGSEGLVVTGRREVWGKP